MSSSPAAATTTTTTTLASGGQIKIENDINSSLISAGSNMNGDNGNNNNNNNGSSMLNNNSNESSNNENNDSMSGSGGGSGGNNQSSGNNNSSDNNNSKDDDVCRDFLRNVCRRGKSCRYKHPDVNDTELMRNKEQYVFCHDFQNRECRRDNCRFLHCTKQEEEIYRSTGKLPPHVQSLFPNDDRNSTPVCKDFLNGTCRRGPRCKYRHPMDNYHNSPPTNRNGPYNGRGGSNYPMSNNMDGYGQSHYGGRGGSNMMPSSNYGYNDNYADAPNKRKRYDSLYHDNNGPYPGAYNEHPPPPPPPAMGANVRTGGNSGGGYGLHSPSQSYGAYGQRSQVQPIESRSYLEEENAALRRRIDDLKKQVSELISTNEYLMEQLRASGQAAVGVAPTSLQPPQQAPPGSVSSNAGVGMSAPITLQAQVPPPQAAAVAIGPLPPVSIVSSIASISLPTASAPVTLVNSSAAASLASFTPSMQHSNPWPLGVDQ